MVKVCDRRGIGVPVARNKEKEEMRFRLRNGIPSCTKRSADCCREIKIYNKIENPDLMTKTRAASEQSSHHGHGERVCHFLSSGHVVFNYNIHRTRRLQ